MEWKITRSTSNVRIYCFLLSSLVNTIVDVASEAALQSMRKHFNMYSALPFDEMVIPCVLILRIHLPWFCDEKLSEMNFDFIRFRQILDVVQCCGHLVRMCSSSAAWRRPE